MKQRINLFNRYLFDDLKIKKLRKKCGLEAYALYCYLMEIINNSKTELLLDEETKECICCNIFICTDSFDTMLDEMFVLDIFDKEYFEKTRLLYNVYAHKKGE